MYTKTILLIICLSVSTNGLDDFLTQLSNNLEGTNGSGQCEVLLRKFVSGVDNGLNWANKLSESTSHMSYGSLLRNGYDFGNFDECVSVNDGAENIHGKYCLGTVHKDNFSDYMYSNIEQTIIRQMDFPSAKWAICIPSACSADKIRSYLRPDILNFNETYCQSGKPHKCNSEMMAFILFGIVLLIYLLSTILDVFTTKSKKESSYIFKICSYASNGKILMEPSDNPSKIQCLSGIQTVSICWLSLGHMFLYTFRFPIQNKQDVLNFVSSQESMYVLKSDLCMDTIFLVAGVLMTNAFMNFKDITFPKILLHYVYRLARLTAPLLALIIVHVSFLKLLGSGPMWPYAEQYMISGCKSSFWSTIFYMRNFINTNETCVDVSWYLSLNMQIFTLSPLLLIPLRKYPKATLSTIVILACACIQMSYYSAWKYHLLAMSDVFKNPSHEKQHYHYHIKIIPSLLGIVVGYFIHRARGLDEKLRIHKIILGMLWITSTVVMLTCVFAGHNLLISNNRAANILYITFVKPSWVIALSWVIFACASGYGGPLDSFLSMAVFRVMAKLSYSMYLLHSTLYMIILYSNKRPVTFSHTSMIYNFLSYFVILVFISFIWTLSFESPIAALSKYFTKSKKETDADTEKSQNKGVMKGP